MASRRFDVQVEHLALMFQPEQIRIYAVIRNRSVGSGAERVISPVDPHEFHASVVQLSVAVGAVHRISFEVGLT